MASGFPQVVGKGDGRSGQSIHLSRTIIDGTR